MSLLGSAATVRDQLIQNLYSATSNAVADPSAANSSRESIKASLMAFQGCLAQIEIMVKILHLGTTGFEEQDLPAGLLSALEGIRHNVRILELLYGESR
jgi:hypothetical protein